MNDAIRRACQPNATIASVLGVQRSNVVGNEDVPVNSAVALSGSVTTYSLLNPSESDAYFAALLSPSDDLTPTFPGGVIGLLTVPAKFFSGQPNAEQRAGPSPLQCVQYLQAAARHEDAFYGLLDPNNFTNNGNEGSSMAAEASVPSLELNSVSSILSALGIAASYLTTRGHNREDIVSTGILPFMGRMALFLGRVHTGTAKVAAKGVTAFVTPAHTELMQLCLLSGQYRYAVTFAETYPVFINTNYFFATSLGSALKSSSDTILEPTVEQYLRYYYYLGMIYTGCQNYAKAMDMWNICITTPTISAGPTSTASQAYGHLSTPTSSMAAGGSSGASNVTVSAIQIAARKKQLLVSCLVACSGSCFSEDALLPPMPLRKPRYGTAKVGPDSCLAATTPVSMEEESEARPGDRQQGGGEDFGDGSSSSGEQPSQVEGILSSAVPSTPKRIAASGSRASTLSMGQNTSVSNFPWSLPAYTSSCVFNLFSFNPSSFYPPSDAMVSTVQTAATYSASPHGLERYHSLVASYWYGDVPCFAQLKQSMADLLHGDGNFGLVQQLQDTFPIRLVYTLSKVYETIPIASVQEYLCLATENDSNVDEQDVLGRALETAIEWNPDFRCEIDQDVGMVSFGPFGETEEDDAVDQFYQNAGARLTQKISQYISLAERIKALDIGIATSKRYQTVIRSRESRAAAAASGGGASSSTLASGAATSRT